MTAEPIEELLAAADEGVNFPGLSVTVDDGTYTFEVPEASFRGLKESEARKAMSWHREYVNEWFFWTHQAPPHDDRFAFLQRLEGAEDRELEARRDDLEAGITTEWGELEIRVKLAEAGRRTYSLRHREDSDERVEELAVYTDPLEARQLRKQDGDGGYRPLTTAPTLARGWAIVDLTAAEVTQAVEHCYPASIANWYREHEGELDVTHWRETAERQTGIYDVVEELPREGVEALAQACCVDSECLKRREWDAAEGEELEVPRGEGSFPCREPCSLVVAAAREWATTEGEDTRTYELELTPSEKAQLERIVAAVADREAEDVGAGEVTDPANHYRARYLRARRMADGTFEAEEHSD